MTGSSLVVLTVFTARSRVSRGANAAVAIDFVHAGRSVSAGRRLTLVYV